MTKNRIMVAEDFKELKESVVLIYGEFERGFFSLFKERTAEKFFVMEGRPDLTAGKTSISGLAKAGIQPTLICDNMAGFLFARGMVKEVWLSYVEEGDRGALCLIGSSILGLLAKKHQVPVYCYASSAKKDVMAESSAITSFQGKKVAPKGVEAYVPLLEWVPGKCFDQDFFKANNE